MYIREITVNNEVGLHARPATFLIQKANEFKCGLWIEKDERRVNAKRCRSPNELTEYPGQNPRQDSGNLSNLAWSKPRPV